MLPAATADIAKFGRLHRDRVRAAATSEAERRYLWEQIIDGPIAQLILSNRWQAAEQALAELLDDYQSPAVGEVYLIGAGPGDPELMTFKALRLLQRADVVLHDRLVNPDIVAMARRDAEKLYVGKRRSEHSVPQERINELLLELAQEGKRVARLKGGDPFVFGRGGEEIELLAQHNIPFQVVPGITAANAAACYSGIPLTHRDFAQSVRFVTGHTKEGKLPHRWEEFLSESETLVFYMGLVGLPIICRELQAHGRSGDTPVALVECATLPTQRLITGTLNTITSLVENASPQPPTLIIVGHVVRLAQRLRWYGSG
jgi:uroporphyrin-III C-methyltransferase/precorrin-2 dehydrogenase/sirohydrochlorin ferrochelatase